MTAVKNDSYKQYFRNNRKGSMLALSIVVLIFIGIVGVFALDTIVSLLNKQLLDGHAQALALQSAAILNTGDRAGRINHLLAGSRDLVYRSRQNLNQTGQVPFDHFRPLAQQLLNQARDGAILLEQERKRLILVRLSEIKRLLLEESNYNAYPDCITSSATEFVDHATVGSYNSQTAEIPSSQLDLALRKYDLKLHYIDEKTGLYYGEIDSKLPDDDEDLSFKLCRLPTLAHGCSLHDAAGYKPYAVIIDQGSELPGGCEQIPSTVAITLCHNYKGMLSHQSYTLSSSSMAATSGPAFR